MLPKGELPETFREHAHSLLDVGFNILAQLRPLLQQSPRSSLVTQAGHLEYYIRSYYDTCHQDTHSGTLDRLRNDIDELRKAFLFVKPYLVEETRGLVPAATSRRIFIVHGKDESNKNALKELLLEWGFDPIILAEQANRGRVLIEKLLDHTSDVGFVFVLMTPDDIGTTMSSYNKLLNYGFDPLLERANVSHSELVELGKKITGTFKARVRQNVIFEYGLCIGSLGRERVCVLLGGDVEIPSDALGYGYTPFKGTVSECKEQILRELKAAGYEPEEREK
jgi:predicted nucleotide-binding protein